MSDYTMLKSNDEEGDRKLMEEALRVVIGNAKQGLCRFRSQELNNIAWTLERLGQRGEELLEQIGLELCNPPRSTLTLTLMGRRRYIKSDVFCSTKSSTVGAPVGRTSWWTPSRQISFRLWKTWRLEVSCRIAEL